MKKIIYLLGAGSTQAEIDFQGIESKTMMSHIASNVFEMSQKENGDYFQLHDNFAFPPNLDIEQLMSLFQGYNQESATYLNIYKEIRKHFRNYLLSQIMDKNIKSPILTTLLHVYKNYGKFIDNEGEELKGVFTTNYDTLTDASFIETYGALNLGYSFKSNTIRQDENVPILIKLHGSFNWKIKGKKLRLFHDEKLKNINPKNKGWLPPSVFKKPKLDLYKKVWSKAENNLLDCDILRIVGCSLRGEDISLLSLLFTSQLRLGNKAFTIDFIDKEDAVKGDDTHQGIINRLSFLTNMRDFSGINGLYDIDKDDKQNPFCSWTKMLINNISIKENKIYDDPTIVNNLKLI
jgi:hypothetical protein